MVYVSSDSTIKFKLAPENHFQATSRKPDTSIFWLMAVLSA